MGNIFKFIKELWQCIVSSFGVVVYRTATLPAATGSANLFTVAGGRVRLTNLTGSIVGVPAGTAATILLRLRHTPTSGIGVTNICADIVDIKGFLANVILTITGAVAVAMASAGGTGVQALHSFATNQQSLEPGVISMLMTEGAGPAGDITGSIRWMVQYVPLDPGATIVPA